jgi:hypothetical protein
MRDPSNYVNLTLTTPTGPQTRSVVITQGIQRVERLRYWRRANDYGLAVPFLANNEVILVNNETILANAETY